MAYITQDKLTLKQFLTYLMKSEQRAFYRVAGNEKKEEQILDQLDWYWYNSSKRQQNIAARVYQHGSYYFWYIPELLREEYDKRFKNK